jgi:hypothetical protein
VMSLSFMVMIVLSMTILILGSVLIVNISNKTSDLEDTTESKFEERFAELNCMPNDKVCIGVIKRQINRGQSDIYIIKIINHFESALFRLSVNPSSSINNSDEEIDNILEVTYNQESFLVENIEEKVLSLGIKVPINASSGTYIFDLTVLNELNGQFIKYGPKLSIYAIVP